MRTFPKSRIDALTDGIFAFAMTLLIIDSRGANGARDDARRRHQGAHRIVPASERGEPHGSARP